MVVIEKPHNYTFVKFQRSESVGKKYDAILKHKRTGRTRRVPFGAINYKHYKDSTPLKLFRNKDHGDKERRARFHARHRNNAKRKFSSAWFASKYLW